jgi:hypothetical protein
MSLTYRTARAGLIALALTGLPVVAHAQAQAQPAAPAPATATDLPSANTIQDKFIAASGGREAWEKITTRTMTGTMEVAAFGMKGTIKTYQKAPNLLRVETDIPGVEKSVQVFDGTIGWATSTNMGARLLSGDELTELKRQATFNAELHPEKLYKTIEVAGKEDLDGKPHFRVVYTPETGNPVVNYFDAESGMLTKIITKATTQMGEVESTSRVSDYRDVGGMIKLPHKATIAMTGQPMEIVMNSEKIEVNAEIPAAMFEPADEIKKLLDKQAAKPAGPR